MFARCHFSLLQTGNLSSAVCLSSQTVSHIPESLYSHAGCRRAARFSVHVALICSWREANKVRKWPVRISLPVILRSRNFYSSNCQGNSNSFGTSVVPLSKLFDLTVRITSKQSISKQSKIIRVIDSEIIFQSRCEIKNVQRLFCLLTFLIH